MSQDPTKTTDHPKAQTGQGSTPSAEVALRTFAELEQHFDSLKRLHAQTAERETELARAAADVERRTREIESRAAELGTSLSRLEEERASLAMESERLAQARQEMDAARADLAAERRALDEERQGTTGVAGKLEQDRRELDQRAADLSAREQALHETEERLGRQQRETDEAAQALARDRAELESILAESGAKEGAIGEQLKAISEREARLAADREDLERRQAELAQQLTALREQGAELDASRKKIDHEQRELAGSQQRLATMVKALQARAQELEEREHALVRREQAAKQGATKADKSGAAIEQQLSELRSALAERTTLLASRDAELAGLRSDAQQLRAELNHAREAAAKAGTGQQTDPGLSAEIEKSRHAIELLAEKLKAAQREGEDLRRLLDTATSTGAGAGPRFSLDAPNLLRRKRLRKYKAMLQAQARKIMTAQATLAKRQSEADMILSHRAKLASAAEHIREREKKITSQRSKSAGAVVAFCSVGVVTLLAGLSWVAAVRFAPATYVASSTLNAESRGRTAAQEDLLGWQEYHTTLAADPRLMDQAAERMARRGLTDLSKGAAVQAYLKTNLSIETPKEGQMVLTLRGADAQRTVTVLDTFVTALSAAANQTRVQRPDGLITDITVPATVPSDPVSHKRLAYAGAIFGGGLFLACAVGLVGVGRVRRARLEAANDDGVVEFLNDDRWPKAQA